MVDIDQIVQAFLGLCIVAGYVGNRLNQRKNAEEVKAKAEAVAAEVATIAKKEADSVASKVEAAGAETRSQLQEIHVMVDGRLDAALQKIENLESRLDAAKGDSPGTAALQGGPDVLPDDFKR